LKPPFKNKPKLGFLIENKKNPEIRVFI